MMAMQGVGVVFAILYFLIIAAVTVLAVWALVLLVIFLRLRIAEMRAASGAGGDAVPGNDPA
jgi:hypothetical protein